MSQMPVSNRGASAWAVRAVGGSTVGQRQPAWARHARSASGRSLARVLPPARRDRPRNKRGYRRLQLPAAPDRRVAASITTPLPASTSNPPQQCPTTRRRAAVAAAAPPAVTPASSLHHPPRLPATPPTETSCRVAPDRQLTPCPRRPPPRPVLARTAAACFHVALSDLDSSANGSATLPPCPSPAVWLSDSRDVTFLPPPPSTPPKPLNI